MTVKTAASRVGNGILDGLSSIADSQTRSEIAQIDTEMETLRKQMTILQERRDKLESRLINN